MYVKKKNWIKLNFIYLIFLFQLQIDGMEDPNGSVQDGTGRHDDNLPAAHYECRFEVGWRRRLVFFFCFCQIF